MTRHKMTRGSCIYCGKEMTRSGMAKHLLSCEQRQAAQAKAAAGKETEQTLYHLEVKDAWSGDYWLHLEMRGNAKLVSLDEYLREIWLECCGHLSAFHIGDWRYTQMFNDELNVGDEKSMNLQVKTLFEPGLEIPYEYDFGTTSELVIKVLGERNGKPNTKHPIVLMARNYPLDFKCMVCGAPATHYCTQCMYENENGECMLCDQHVEEHECDEYGPPSQIYNSPRLGMCGYDGPAEPPY
ncbi:MAG: hypothetical protein U0175_03470 [Caldilineaceae bacterium]